MGKAFAIEDFLDFSNASPESKAVYEGRLRKLEEWGGKPVGGWDLEDAKKVRAKLTGMGSGAQYAQAARMFFGAAWKLSRDPRYLILAEALEMRGHKQKRLRPDEILEPREVKALMEARKRLGYRSPYEWWIPTRDVALIGAIWDFGGRISEVLALRIKDVGFKEARGKDGTPHRVYTAWFGEVKEDGEEHEGFLVDTAAALEAWLAVHPWRDNRDAYVFPTTGGRRLVRTEPGKMLKRCAKAAGVTKPVNPHAFRHARVTHLKRLGVDDSAVVKLIGWKDAQMLKRYGHLTSQDGYAGLARAMGFVRGEEVTSALEFGPLEVKPAVPTVPVVAPAGIAPVSHSSGDVTSVVAEALLRDPRLKALIDAHIKAAAAGTKVEARVEVESGGKVEAFDAVLEGASVDLGTGRMMTEWRAKGS